MLGNHAMLELGQQAHNLEGWEVVKREHEVPDGGFRTVARVPVRVALGRVARDGCGDLSRGRGGETQASGLYMPFLAGTRYAWRPLPTILVPALNCLALYSRGPTKCPFSGKPPVTTL